MTAHVRLVLGQRDPLACRCEIEDRRVGLVDHALEKLEIGGHEMIDLQGDRAQEEDDEPVIDQRVHDPGPSIAHQRLHPKPIAQTLETLSPLTCPFLSLTLFPAGRSLRKQVERQPEECRHTDIEDHYQFGRDVAEDFSPDLELGVAGNSPQVAQCEGSDRGENPDRLQNL